MSSNLNLWIKSAKMHIAARMAYRADYFISLIAMFVLEMIGPIFTYVIYSNTDGYPGWTFYQILLIQAILLIVRGFSFFAFNGIIWNTNIILQRGEFDRILIYPRNTLFMFICESFDSEDIAKFVGGILLAGYAISQIPGIHILNFLIMIILIIIGIGLYFAFGLLMSAYVFKVTRTFRIYEILDVIELFGKYPKSIYPKSIGVFFTAIIPIFIASVFPVHALLGNLGLEILISTISVIILIIIAIKIWFATIKSYSSAGG